MQSDEEQPVKYPSAMQRENKRSKQMQGNRLREWQGVFVRRVIDLDQSWFSLLTFFFRGKSVVMCIPASI